MSTVCLYGWASAHPTHSSMNRSKLHRLICPFHRGPKRSCCCCFCCRCWSCRALRTFHHTYTTQDTAHSHANSHALLARTRVSDDFVSPTGSATFTHCENSSERYKHNKHTNANTHTRILNTRYVLLIIDSWYFPPTFARWKQPQTCLGYNHIWFCFQRLRSHSSFAYGTSRLNLLTRKFVYYIMYAYASIICMYTLYVCVSISMLSNTITTIHTSQNVHDEPVCGAFLYAIGVLQTINGAR